MVINYIACIMCFFVRTTSIVLCLLRMVVNFNRLHNVVCVMCLYTERCLLCGLSMCYNRATSIFIFGGDLLCVSMVV